jgi:imidazolonepropionase-like amidohydrolase
MQPMKARELVLKSRVMGAMAALIATTRTNAELFRLDQDLGTVEEGKRADLIVVDGDPVSDISCIEDADRVHLVIKDGRIRKDQQREAVERIHSPAGS